MKKQSESRKRKLHAFNNRGASLITVIITIGFVAILISILMMTSLINFKMKRVNAYAKDTFYSAEQVLDEINIGLQRYISDSLSSAYVDVMENYTDYDSEKKNIGEVIIAKNRHGETGNVELVWFGQVQKFADKIREI